MEAVHVHAARHCQPPGLCLERPNCDVFPECPFAVHDAYVAGTGVLHPALFGLVSLGTVQGAGEIARGELMRWLAESIWYPTVLLPGQGLSWQPVDDTSALATLTDGPITLTMLFRFGEDGLVSGIRVEARGGVGGGRDHHDAMGRQLSRLPPD